jgi:hypothetical protein
MRLINLRILVCETCLDTPQIQLRTILLPPDPVPIEYPVPENYQSATNPLSANGFAATDLTTVRPSSYGTMNIGTINGAGGMNAVWDGVANKQSFRSAKQDISNAGYQNFVGKSWNAIVATNAAQSIQPPVAYNVTGFTVTAPSDAAFLSTGPTGLQLQGSNDGVSWIVLYNIVTLGTKGEVVTSHSSILAGGNYQNHRVAIQGDGTHPVAIAQVALTVSNTGQNEM